eukprot:913420_1
MEKTFSVPILESEIQMTGGDRNFQSSEAMSVPINAGEVRLDIIADECPSVAGESPSAVGGRPSVAGERLSAVGERPSMAGERSSVAGGRQSAAGEAEKSAGEESSSVKKSSIFSASANLFNSVIGVGIIVLPVALLKCGLIFGIIVASLMALCSYYTSMLMVTSAEKVGGITSYADLCRKGIGQWGFYALTLMTFLLMFGAMVMYCIIFKDLLQQVIEDWTSKPFDHPGLVLVAAAVLIMLPLGLLKDMSSLSKASVLSTGSVFVILAIVCVKCPSYGRLMKDLNTVKMDLISADLLKDRAMFICEYYSTAKSGTPCADHESRYLKASAAKSLCTDDKLWEKLNDDKCGDGKFGAVSQTKVAAAFTDDQWETIHEAHSVVLYHTWSINDADAKKFHSDFNIWGFARIAFFLALGTFNSAFIAQQTVFGIYSSLRKPSTANWAKVLKLGYGAVFAASMLCAMVGYFSASYQARDFVFSTMQRRFLLTKADGGNDVDYATNIARILLILTIALTYPMQLFFGRLNLTLLIKEILGVCNQTLEGKENVLFYAITGLMWSVSVGIGLTSLSLGFVVDFIGAMFAGPLVFVLPTLAFFGLEGGVKAKWEDVRGDTSKTVSSFILPLVILILGIVMTLFSPVMTIWAQLDPSFLSLDSAPVAEI